MYLYQRHPFILGSSSMTQIGIRALPDTGKIRGSLRVSHVVCTSTFLGFGSW